MCAARTEFRHRPALRSANYPVSLSSYERLVIYHQQQIRFHKLRLYRRRADGYQRLARENYRALGNCVNIARKFEIAKVFEKTLVESIL